MLFQFAYFSLRNVVVAIVTFLLTYMLYEQFSYARKRGMLPGPTFSVPYLGQLFQMVFSPWKFWETQESYGALSWNAVVGRFMLFSRDPATSRLFLGDSEHFTPLLQLAAKEILGERCMVFQQGPDHKAMRHQLVPLFTKRALSVYMSVQESMIRSFIDKVSTGDEVIVRDVVRSMNFHTASSVFFGNYLTLEEKQNLERHYRRMNEGFLSLPFNIPGLGLWKARRAHRAIIAALESCAAKSLERMCERGLEPQCLLDVWMESAIKTNNIPTTYRIADTMVTFLFASQDASTSSLTWVIHLLSQHPDVLAKVRAEVDTAKRPEDPYTFDVLQQLSYTRQVVLEILRFRPPATMVPYETTKEMQLEDGYKVPVGTVVLPSLWCARNEGWSNPETFNPDRMGPELNEMATNANNFLAFGYGPHKCLGKEYAQQHLSLFTALVAQCADWTRLDTPKSDTIELLPTIFPADGVPTIFTKRIISTAT